MTCDRAFCIASASSGSCLSERIRGGARQWGIFVPQTSHEGSWCQASIALPNQKFAPAASLVSGPALPFFSNLDQLLTDVGRVELWATH
jgi:hypothetical protein